MIPFLFAVHCHQPVGNFDHVFKKALERCYQPFLETVAEYPFFRFALHYSGCLLEWLEEHAPSHLDLIRDLVRRGQVELLGGGYYEPILSAIPARDARGQLSFYLARLEELFGQRPEGIWLTERVWDPSLPSLLADLGVRYTLVDDTHFRFAGIEPEKVWGPFITEREGKSIILFPIDKKLRYYIPFREPEETIEYLFARAENNPGFAACYGDDGEKFGMWPDTYEWVHEKGWLKRFLSALEREKDRVRTGRFSDYLEAVKPRARVYLPPASYDEMMEWTLPPRLGRVFEDFLAELEQSGKKQTLAPFVRGGHWDMFLAKYEEANLMHKRMLLASRRVAALARPPETSLKALYRSQCNCAYWHGVFGGLYLNYLRHAVYRQILEAEAGLIKKPRVEIEDYDKDGHKEVIYTSPRLNLVVCPARGGALSVIEYPPARFSLSNLLARREETYHRKLRERIERPDDQRPKTIHERVAVKEEGLERFLVYDRFPRFSLQEHFTHPVLTLSHIENEQAEELFELAAADYKLLAADEKGIRMERETGSSEQRIHLAKQISFPQEETEAGFAVHYRITNAGEQNLEGIFAAEWNLTLLAGDDPQRHYLIDNEMPPEPTMNGKGEHREVNKVELVNLPDKFKVALSSAQAFTLFRFPVMTVSQSESGFERTYQGSCLWLAWPVNLEPGRSRSLSLCFFISPLPG